MRMHPMSEGDASLMDLDECLVIAAHHNADPARRAASQPCLSWKAEARIARQQSVDSMSMQTSPPILNTSYRVGGEKTWIHSLLGCLSSP